MNSQFKPIDVDFSEEDIISVDNKLFEIKQFKEESKSGLQKILSNNVVYLNSHPSSQKSLRELLCIRLTVVEVGQAKITGNLSWESETIDGKVLRLGSKNWQKVKLRFRIVCTRYQQSHNNDKYFSPQEVFIEYCRDEPEVPESPLDEMRKMFKQN